MSETPTGTDRVELTEDEREALAEPVYDAYRLGKYGKQEYLPMWHELDHQQPPNSVELKRVLDAVESIVAARLSTLAAERDKAWADLVTINTAKVAAEAELAALVTALGFDTRDPMIGRTHAERATEMVKRYDDLAAELAAANARCETRESEIAEVVAQKVVAERDALAARCAELQLIGDWDEWACKKNQELFRDAADERDALQARVDELEADRADRVDAEDTDNTTDRT